jgi:streptogramin lyase
MRTSVTAAVAGGALALAGSAAGAPTLAPLISVGPGSSPQGIVAGVDGNVWYAEFGGRKIGRITPTGLGPANRYPLSGGTRGGPAYVSRGPDGAMYFTTTGTQTDPTPSGLIFGPFMSDLGSIGRIDPVSGTVCYFRPPLPNSAPVEVLPHPPSNLRGIATSGGKLWVVDRGNDQNRLISFTPAVGCPISTAFNVIDLGNDQPEEIVAGLDNRLYWSNTGGGGSVGSIANTGTTAADVAHLQTGGDVSTPSNVTLGPDGNIWFTEETQADGVGGVIGDHIGYVSPGGVAIRFPLALGTNPSDIHTGLDGALYFLSTNPVSGADKVVRAVITGPNSPPAMTDFPITDPSWQKMFGITSGANGDMYFTEFESGPGAEGSRIGKITGTLNAPAAIAIGPTAGTAFSGPVASFTGFTYNGDPAAGGYTASINWGDGTAPSVGTITAAAGTFTVSGSHTYAAGAARTAPVNVTLSRDGASISAAGTATIKGSTVVVPPKPPPPPPPPVPPVNVAPVVTAGSINGLLSRRQGRVRTTLRANENCSVRVEIRLTRAMAKRLGINIRRSFVVIGRSNSILTANISRTITANFTRLYRAKIKSSRGKGVRIVVRIRCADPQGASRIISRTVTFR